MTNESTTTDDGFTGTLVDDGWTNFAARYREFEAQQELDQRRLRKLAADAANGILPDDADPNDPEIIAITSPETRFAMAAAPKTKAVKS